jgi:hypothetical protein
MENMNVPYIVYESAEAKNERIIKRLIIALVITIVLMFATNIIWIIEFCSFDYNAEETTIEANDGTANYIGQDGDITYGTDNSTEEKQKEKT